MDERARAKGQEQSEQGPGRSSADELYAALDPRELDRLYDVVARLAVAGAKSLGWLEPGAAPPTRRSAQRHG